MAATYFRLNFGVKYLHVAYPYGGMARRIVKPRDLSDRWEIPRFDMRDVFEADNRLRAEKLRALFSSD